MQKLWAALRDLFTRKRKKPEFYWIEYTHGKVTKTIDEYGIVTEFPE